MLSEIIEPVAREANGAEIQSSEEALSVIDALNERALVGNWILLIYCTKSYLLRIIVQLRGRSH